MKETGSTTTWHVDNNGRHDDGKGQHNHDDADESDGQHDSGNVQQDKMRHDNGNRWHNGVAR